MSLSEREPLGPSLAAPDLRAELLLREALLFKDDQGTSDVDGDWCAARVKQNRRCPAQLRDGNG